MRVAHFPLRPAFSKHYVYDSYNLRMMRTTTVQKSLRESKTNNQQVCIIYKPNVLEINYNACD